MGNTGLAGYRARYYAHIDDGVKRWTCLECEKFSVTVRLGGRARAIEWMNDHLAEHEPHSNGNGDGTQSPK